MFRRNFLKTSAFAAVGALAGETILPAMAGQIGKAAPPVVAKQPVANRAASKPFRIRMGGYGPPTTGFSLALKRIGDQLKAKFGDDVDVKYVYNIMDLGYRAEDILWLVEDGILTVGYQ